MFQLELDNEIQQKMAEALSTWMNLKKSSQYKSEVRLKILPARLWYIFVYVIGFVQLINLFSLVVHLFEYFEYIHQQMQHAGGATGTRTNYGRARALLHSIHSITIGNKS